MQTSIVNHYDHVVSWNGSHWPAWKRADGTLVDLRLFDPTDHTERPRQIYRPEELQRAGVPEHIVKAAAESNPPGFVLLAKEG